MEPGPVFVAGLERSGTSLLYALLASHPNLAMTRRTNLWTHFYNQYGDLGDPANLDRCIDVMMRYKRIVKLEPDEALLRRDFLRGPPTYGRLFAALEQQYAERHGRSRWGDKSLNTERYADPIFAAYPGARILHMIRDPRDRYASSQTRWQVRRGGAGAGTAEWLSSVRLAERNARRYPDNYRIVRYESLAGDPEPTMRGICAFIGEQYTPGILAMEGAQDFRDQGSNSSYGARAAGVISTDSIGRYRDVLSPRQIAFMQMVAGRAIRRMGYEVHIPGLARRDRLQYLAVDLPLELARLAAWHAHNSVRNRTGRPLPTYRLVARYASP
jgi:Sulfotransferase family